MRFIAGGGVILRGGAVPLSPSSWPSYLSSKLSPEHPISHISELGYLDGSRVFACPKGPQLIEPPPTLASILQSASPATPNLLITRLLFILIPGSGRPSSQLDNSRPDGLHSSSCLRNINSLSTSAIFPFQSNNSHEYSTCF